MTLMIVLSILIALVIFGVMIHSMNRLYFNEKEAEVIDHIPSYSDDYPNRIAGYYPVVKFEVEGKVYQGKLHVFPLWLNKDQRKTTVLYNPKNPAEFVAKESSSNPANGCILAVVLIIALGVAIFFYLRNH